MENGSFEIDKPRGHVTLCRLTIKRAVKWTKWEKGASGKHQRDSPRISRDWTSSPRNEKGKTIDRIVRVFPPRDGRFGIQAPSMQNKFVIELFALQFSATTFPYFSISPPKSKKRPSAPQLESNCDHVFCANFPRQWPRDLLISERLARNGKVSASNKTRGTK